MPAALRLIFFVSGIMQFLAIALTGFAVVHWFAYVPATAFVLAGVTGICPGLQLFQRLGLRGPA